MADAVPIKYYSSRAGQNIKGEIYPQVITAPGYNTPAGYYEISYAEYIATLKQIPNNQDASGGTMYDYYAKNDIKQISPNQESGYVVDPKTGNLTTQAKIDEQAGYEAGVANGTLKEIEPGKYVPVDSPAGQSTIPTTPSNDTVTNGTPSNPAQNNVIANPDGTYSYKDQAPLPAPTATAPVAGAPTTTPTKPPTTPETSPYTSPQPEKPTPSPTPPKHKKSTSTQKASKSSTTS